MEKEIKHISKLMSLVLRHQPEAIGLQLDDNGWANVQELMCKMNASGTAVDAALLDIVVTTNDKQRFGFNADKSMIRANQGHSLKVELNLQQRTPPDVLFHGTADRFVPDIMKKGLTKQQRRHVHLSWQMETAKAVGARHGKPVILSIDAGIMHTQGFVFYLSDNNVWLTDHVPVEFIKL